MAGIVVDRTSMDNKIATAVLALRGASDQCSHVQNFLVNNPVVNSVDPLTAAPFNYTADEAYAIRLVFQNFAADYTNQAANFAIASKFTGLE
jgi:hypothetical protein